MPEIVICQDEIRLINKLSKLIEKVSVDSINEKGSFYVGFSGGSVVKFLVLGLPTIKTDFSKWHIFFCDERVVPFDSPDSTFGLYKYALLDKVPIKEEQFIQIKQGISAHDAAEDYLKKLKELFGGDDVPKFDMLLLGMGPDGHTCSLFPGHSLLNETNNWVMPITDSPKPPPERITLTFPVLNNAKNCVFALAGKGKAEIVKRILVDKEDLPSGRVQPVNGHLYWLLDKDAASLL